MNTIFSKKTTGTETLASRHAALREYSGDSGRKLGLRGLPKPSGDSLKPYIGPIIAGYRNLLSTYVKQRTGNEEKVAELERSSLVSRQTYLENRINELRSNQLRHSLESGGAEYVAPNRAKNAMMHVILALLSIMDALLAKRAIMQTDSFGNMAGIVMFVALLGLFYIIPQMVVWVVRRVEQEHRRAVCIALGIGLAIGFMAISVMRSKYNPEASTIQGVSMQKIQINAAYYAVIQIFIMSAAIMAAFSMKPTDQEYGGQLKAKGIHEKMAKTEDGLAKAEAELHSIPDRISRSEAARADSSSREAGTEAQIRAMYAEAISEFQNENTLYQNQRPSCFDDEIPNL